MPELGGDRATARPLYTRAVSQEPPPAYSQFRSNERDYSLDGIIAAHLGHSWRRRRVSDRSLDLAGRSGRAKVIHGDHPRHNPAQAGRRGDREEDGGPGAAFAV